MARPPRSTQQDWIDAGYRALRLGGIAGIRIERLAEELGVGRAGFYHRFAGREELIHAVLEKWWGLAARLFAEAAAGVDDPEEQLRRYGKAVLTVDELREADGWLLLHDPLDPTFVDRARTSRSTVEQWTTDVLRALAFDDAEARRRADILYVGYLGLLADIEAQPERPTDAVIEQRFDALVDVVIGPLVGARGESTVLSD